MEKILRLNYYLFPFVTIMSLSFLFVESVTYSGFLSQYLILNAKAFMFLDLLSGILLVFPGNKLKYKKEGQINSLCKFLFQLNYLITPVLCVFYYLMISAEATNYSNYVFSTFHVIPDNFIYFAFLSVCVSIFGIFFEGNFLGLTLSVLPMSKGRGGKLEAVREFSALLIFLSVFLLTAWNGIGTMKIVIKNNIFIFRNLGYTYDQKMLTSWNDLYRYLQLVKRVTPENSVIKIPPSVRPWLSEGNSVLVRYFLYPRKLISPDEPESQKLDPDYFFVAKGLWKVSDPSEYGWPREDVDAERIYYFDLESGKISEENKKFFASDPKNKNSWGLIKVSKHGNYL